MASKKIHNTQTLFEQKNAWHSTNKLLKKNGNGDENWQLLGLVFFKKKSFVSFSVSFSCLLTMYVCHELGISSFWENLDCILEELSQQSNIDARMSLQLHNNNKKQR